MNFFTKIPLSKQRNTIDYTSRMLLLGSCFAENIGGKCSYFKFRTLQNPFGILFHAIAIENLMARALLDNKYEEQDVFFQNGNWHCYDAHSSLSSGSKEQLLYRLNAGLSQLRNYMRSATHICITLGTAWVYRHKDSERVVANCHKVPQTKFQKELLKVEELQESLGRIVQMVHDVQPSVQVIFTVSPVRHLKDGVVENQQSKSHLISAVHQLLQKDKISYFPSYEIMMDELRDYRFYTKDMIHPNDIAIDYIWERFQESWIADGILGDMKKVDDIQRGLGHKPFHPEGEAHQKFLTSLRGKIAYIIQKYPFMDFNSTKT
ncbi:GSCFA family protein [Maribacter sedimenticola]|uniref:GSCFA family protein n=1 Tax=Maribacter sedimenticola TaxID=228956 RepID=A0ABY1SLF1_9FLAO|nr:GSCFA domain-containing protein [Maribacter sedimenticola]SNR75455.1 GSCFA family protein [Maribacter sedimenticola]